MKNKHPAEVARGLVFQENFENLSDINKNGGVVTGSALFRDRGMVFDGSTNYITYAGKGDLSQQSYLSVAIEFTPSFAYGDGFDHFFFDTPAGARTVFYKSAASQLVFNCFGTGIFVLEAAAYSAYWKTNQRNVFVFAGTTSSQKLYLNGVQVGSATTPYTKATNTNFYIGASNAGTLKFAGTMHSFKVFVSNVSALTAAEALGYYNNDWTQYDKKATCILPMTADCHDATNGKTLDTSGRGNNATIATSAIKLPRRGYSVASPNYFTLPALAIGTYSLVVQFMPTTGSDRELFGDLVTGTSVYRNGDNNRIISSFGGTIWNDGKQTISNYLNAKQVTVVTGLTYPAANAATIFHYTNGEIYHFALYPFALTPLQILDLTLKLKKQINMV